MQCYDILEEIYIARIYIEVSVVIVGGRNMDFYFLFWLLCFFPHSYLQRSETSVIIMKDLKNQFQ